MTCPLREDLHWFWLACIAAAHVWDDVHWQELSASHVEAARNVGALSELPLALSSRAFMLLLAGELAAAGSLIEEIQAATDATGSNFAPYAALALAAFRGNQAEVATLTETTLGDVTERGEGLGITLAESSNAVLNNGLGRYEEAMDAAARAADCPSGLGAATWALVEFIEAAAHSGMRREAVDAHRPAGRDDRYQWHRLGARHRCPLRGAARRWRRRRRPVPGIDRASRPDLPSRRAGPRAPVVRRVAAPRTTTR